jgi:hypothetical protein
MRMKRVFVLPALLVCMGLMIAAAGCRGGGARAVPEDSTTLRPIAEVLAAHADSIMAIAGVAGIYEARREDGTPCIRVLVVRLTESLRARLPRSLGGYPVEIEESGEIRAMPGDSVR